MAINICKPDQVLEYAAYNEKIESIIVNDKEKEIYLGPDRNMWLWPGRSYFVPTGVRFWFPKDTIGLVTENLWINPKIHVHPSVVNCDDTEVYLTVQNLGFLPRPVVVGQMLANLTVIPKNECHIVNLKGQS